MTYICNILKVIILAFLKVIMKNGRTDFHCH